MDTIDIWSARVAAMQDPAWRERAYPLLTQAETDRARRFHFEKDRDLFLLARLLVRTVLANVLNCAPEACPLRVDKRNKPCVEGYPVHFNLSHTRDVCLLAVSPSGPIGTDVEDVYRDLPDSLIQTATSADERHWVEQATGLERAQRFFRLWTLKESFLKALGYGLARPLTWATFPEGKTTPILHPDSREKADDWRFVSMDLGDAYLAATARRGPDAVVEQHTWVG